METSKRVSALRDIQESTKYRFEPTQSRTAGGISTAAARDCCSSSLNRFLAPKVLAGVLSDVYQPYRPLGTPVFGTRAEQAISDSPEAVSLPPGVQHEAGYYHPQLGVPLSAGTAVGASGEKIYQVDRTAPLGANGYLALKQAVVDSAARKQCVRNGGSLDQVMHSTPGKNLMSRKRKTAAINKSQELKLPPLPQGMTDNSSEKKGTTAVVDVFFNPAHTVKDMREGFEDLRGQAIRRLEKVLKRMDETRSQNYDYKMQSLGSNLSSSTSGNPEQNHEKWRLQAEKNRLESQLNAIESHKWFLKLLEMVTENGRHMTYPEEHVVGEIKKIIEMGEAFDVLDFLTMIACVPRSYHENDFVKRIFDFLRDNVGIKPLEYRDFLEQRGLPVPQELSHLSRNQLGKLGTNSNKSSRLGVRRMTFHQTHDKLMQDVFAGISPGDLDPLKGLEVIDTQDTASSSRSTSQ